MTTVSNNPSPGAIPFSSGLALNQVAKSFGAVSVLRDINLAVNEGEFIVFVGPSGCGKSTLLRMIAGLEDVSSGMITIEGRDVTYAEPSERGIAMVFQSYALYPHLSVRDNMGFSLKMAGRPRTEVAATVEAAAEVLHLGPLLDRRPAQLSGGQRQRVAIGRAIVRNPRVFLFDEPLSNLDAELRVEMRIEIAKLHRRLGNTMVYVTHDQTEAMTLADRIVVLRGGRIEQVGTPAEIYCDPGNLFVAGFIGSPKINVLPGKFTERGARYRRLHPACARRLVGTKAWDRRLGGDPAASDFSRVGKRARSSRQSRLCRISRRQDLRPWPVVGRPHRGDGNRSRPSARPRFHNQAGVSRSGYLRVRCRWCPAAVKPDRCAFPSMPPI